MYNPFVSWQKNINLLLMQSSKYCVLFTPDYTFSSFLFSHHRPWSHGCVSVPLSSVPTQSCRYYNIASLTKFTTPHPQSNSNVRNLCGNKPNKMKPKQTIIFQRNEQYELFLSHMTFTFPILFLSIFRTFSHFSGFL